MQRIVYCVKQYQLFYWLIISRLLVDEFLNMVALKNTILQLYFYLW